MSARSAAVVSSSSTITEAEARAGRSPAAAPPAGAAALVLGQRDWLDSAPGLAGLDRIHQRRMTQEGQEVAPGDRAEQPAGEQYDDALQFFSMKSNLLSIEDGHISTTILSGNNR